MQDDIPFERDEKLRRTIHAGPLDELVGHGGFMNEQDVIDRLGEPDAVLPPGRGMTSTAWLCIACKRLHEFDEPVRPPAPCGCGCIAFEKRARTQH